MNIDGIVIMLSSIAICNKWKIKSKFPIDKVLYDNLLNIPNVYKKYYSKHPGEFENVTIDELNLILEIPICERKNQGLGLNTNITPISMGIDSLHTILSNKEKINHLININGMDLSNKIPNFNDILNQIAIKYNKPLITANSNFKKLILSLTAKNSTPENIIKLPGINYFFFTCDPILLASCYPLGIKKLFFSGLGLKYIPGLNGQSYEINKFFKSNEFTTILNDTEKIKKIDFIVKKDEELIKNMRVCNEWPFKKMNCSKCIKCLKTILEFYMLGYYPKLNYTFDILNEKQINLELINFPKFLVEKNYKYPHEFIQFFNLYLKNNKKPLKNIINQYDGFFNGEEYHLFPKKDLKNN